MITSLNNWKRKHNFVKINNELISYIDEGSGPNTILFLHDFGTNSISFSRQIEELGKSFRVIAPDFIGFGLSDKPRNYYYSIIDQSQMIINLLKSLNINKLAIVGHGYGSSVICQLLSQVQMEDTSLKITNIIFLNGSLTIELTSHKNPQEIISNAITKSFGKISYSFSIYKKYFGMSLYNPFSISNEEYELFWELISEKKGQKFIQFIDYCIVERKQFANRWINTLINTDVKVDLIWGDKDPLSPLKFAHQLNKMVENSKLHVIPNCGHFPGLESPSVLSEIIKNQTYEERISNS